MQEQQIPKIYSAISAIMSDIDSIAKDRKNQQQGYNFRGIDDIYNALHDILAKHKVFVTSDVLEQKREDRESRGGGTLIYTIYTMRFTFFAEDGSSVSSTTVGEAMDSGDKSSNKAMSTAYKYALMQIFCIPTQDEKDTEIQTHEVRPKSKTNAPAAVDPIEAERREFFNVARGLGKSDAEARTLAIAYFNVDTFEDITFNQLRAYILALRTKLAKNAEPT